MEGVKGYLPSKDHFENFHHGPNFQFPSKMTTTTEANLKEIIPTTTEAIRNISSIINDIFTNSSSTANTTGLGNAADSFNNTFIDETLRSNATATDSNLTSTINDIFNIGRDQNTTEGVKTIVDGIRTTTESLTNYVTSTVSDIITSTVNGDQNMNSTEHNMHTSGPKTSYIVMGLLVAILFVIIVCLLVIYMYYKKKNSANISGQYHSHASTEIPTSSTKDLNQTVLYHNQSER